MSIFHESIREILKDFYFFLDATLHQELLSSVAIASKIDLQNKILELKNAYPQLQLDLSPTKGEMCSPHRQLILHSPVDPPPPYVDMHGNGIKDICDVKKHEGSYEPCDKGSFTESDDNQSGDGWIKWESHLPAVAATGEFEKCGFLEKKGKERFGGLIKPSQQRWYGIKDFILYSYEKPTDRVQKGAVALPGYEARPILSKDKKNQFSFELVCPGKRSYQFSAASAKEVDQWLAAFERNGKGDKKTMPVDVLVKNVESQNNQECEEIYEMVDEKEEAEKNRSSLSSSIPTAAEEGSLDASAALSQALNYRNLYICIWDCQSLNNDELSFHRGDIIQIVSKEYDSYSWWIGKLHGKVGFVPKSYVMEAYKTF